MSGQPRYAEGRQSANSRVSLASALLVLFPLLAPASLPSLAIEGSLSTRPAIAAEPSPVHDAVPVVEGASAGARNSVDPAADAEDQPQRFTAVATVADLIHIGIALAFALLHLCLFAFFRRETGNLYFAVFALGFAGMTWGTYVLDHRGVGTSSAELFNTLRFTFTCGVVQAFALQRFAHVEFQRRAPKLFYLLLVWGAAVVIWIWATPDTALRIQPVMYLALATTVELLRTVALAIREPQRAGTWLIYLGLALLAGAGALQSLLTLRLIGSSQPRIYAYGVLLFLLTISVYLSRRFATTALELEKQLGEVRRLSERTLEQERQAKQHEIESRLLQAENDRRAEELEEARRLQLSMVPQEAPSISGLEVAFQMRTATEVGGDYYDFRVGEGGALTLAVGDATGHGLNAGLVVASTKSLFQALDGSAELTESLRCIDQGLRGMELKRMGMSLTLARYQAGELKVAAAGMPPVLVFREATSDVKEVVLSAPPLGTLKQRSFDECVLSLSRGDAILFATDGLVELLDPDDEALGYTALAESFATAAKAGAMGAVDRLLERANEWARGRPLADDLTLVVLRVLGQP